MSLGGRSEGSAISDVSCICTAPVVAELRDRGLPAERLVEDLPVELAQLENPRSRIPWDPFTVVAHRASEMLGGPHQIEELAWRSAEEVLPGFVRRLLPHVVSARPLYHFGARFWGPHFFRGTRGTCEDLPDGRLREIVEILPDRAACPEFFDGMRGWMRAVPRLLGQDEAQVELEQDGRRGEFLIAPPPSARRIRFGRRDPAHRLAETTRRLDSLSRLGRELARHAGLRELGDALLGLLEEQLDVRALQLWWFERGGEGPVFLATRGDPSGGSSERFEIRGVGGPIGRLEVFGVRGRRLVGEDAKLLRELLPWIGVALEHARTRDDICRLTILLENEVRDWQRVERSLQQLFGEEDAGAHVASGLLRGMKTVLLVEENPVTRFASRSILEARGYAVIEAGSGEEALRVCEERPDVDLVVTDADSPSLPHGFARRALQLRPRLRGVLLLQLRQS